MLGVFGNTAYRRELAGAERVGAPYLAETPGHRQAYAAPAELGPQWPEDYFQQGQQQIEAQLAQALLKDLKVLEPSSNLPRRFAQLTPWHAEGLLARQRSLIEQVLGQWGDDWLRNLISLDEGKRYLLSASPASAAKLERLLERSALEVVHCLSRPTLRKELLRKGLALQATSCRTG